MSSYLEKTTRIHFKLQNSNNHYGPAVSRIMPKKSPDLLAHDCPTVLTKGVKITPGPTLSIPLALRNSSREEELKRSCSRQSNHHSSVSQTPRLSRGNPMNRHLSNTFGVLIWTVWLKIVCCALFFLSLFKEKKKKVGRWLNILTPPKTFTKLTGVSLQRERAMIRIMCQPVCPEEIESPAPGER